MGRDRSQRETEQSRNVSTALKASVFGLVAFLLGFSFSMTSNRHDVRRRVTLDKANAVGTCYLRAGLIGEPEEGLETGVFPGELVIDSDHESIPQLTIE